MLYAAAPMLWALGCYLVPQLGAADANAMVFSDRFSDAVATIYAGADGGDGTDAVFAHEGSIAIWTLMNVDNPDFGLIHQQALTTGELLPYTGIIEIRGNPGDGWTLISWDGHPVPQEPGLLTELFVDVRDFITAPQLAGYHIGQALLGGDPTAIAAAIQTGADEVGAATMRFPLAVIADLFDVSL